MMLYKTGNSTYPSNATQLGNADIRASKTVYDTAGNNFYYCYNQATDEFAIGARTISNSAAYIINSLGGLQQVGSVTGDNVCQSIALTGWTDPNTFISNGYTNGSGWQSWVK